MLSVGHCEDAALKLAENRRHFLTSDPRSILALVQRGDFRAAKSAASKAVARDKSNPALHNLHGIALSGLGQYKEGIDRFSRALVLAPDFHEARKNLAQTLILAGQANRAVTQLEKLARVVPEDAVVHLLLAQALVAQGRWAEAEAAATEALNRDPTEARALAQRGLIRDRMGKPILGIADYGAALALRPDDVETLVNISLPLARQTRTDEALAAVQRALTLAPNHLGARLRLASQWLEMGEMESARQEYREALRIAPGHPEALEQLAAISSLEDSQELQRQVESALKSARRKTEARASLLFAQAEIARRSGDPRAAAWLAEANAEIAATRAFDPEADALLSRQITKRFTVAGPAVNVTSEPRPVYVLGLPRSGTTLAEAILGAHPKVAPLGERATAGILLYPIIEDEAQFGALDACTFRQAYQDALPHLPDDTLAYVDKMPENYRLIGFLKMAFPESRIVNLRRDPRDVALSMWRAHFTGRALSYAYDLKWMAERFNGYARMMRHWHQILPGQILDLSYEEIVEDVEAAGRKLADFCELEWDEAMAHPESSLGQVLTLSARDVRQRVHTRSVGRWKAEAETIRPFIDALDPDLWPELGAA